MLTHRQHEYGTEHKLEIGNRYHGRARVLHLFGIYNQGFLKIIVTTSGSSSIPL